jgi:uncharacterized membrane protein YfcA
MALGACAAGALGFGDALVAMPLLSALLGIEVAIPLVGASSFLNCAAGLALEPRAARWREAGGLLAGALPAVPLGVALSQGAPAPLLELGLGLLLLWISTRGLRSPPPLRALPAWPFGLASGLLGGCLNTSGPPLVWYAALRGWGPGESRATLQACFFALTALVLLSHLLEGLWAGPALQLWPCLGGLALGLPLGRWLHHRLPVEGHGRRLLVLLGLLGLITLLRLDWRGLRSWIY